MNILKLFRNLFRKKKKSGGWRYTNNPPRWVVKRLAFMKHGTIRYVKGKHFEYKLILVPLENHFGYDYYKRELRR